MSTSTAVCQRCAAELFVEGIPPQATVLCVRCGAELHRPRPKDPRRLSRKAVFSVVLGAGSLLLACLSGIPAIVLGIWALIDLVRHEDELRGKAVAVTGIVLGIVWGLACAPLFIALLLPAVQKARQAAERERVAEVLRDPGRVAAEAARIGDFKLPDKFRPTHWAPGDYENSCELGYLDPRDQTMIALIKIKEMAPALEQVVAQRLRELARPLRPVPPKEHQVAWRVAGQTVQVAVETGPGKGQQHRRQYMAVFSHGGYVYGILVSTGDKVETAQPAPGNAAVLLSEDEIRAFVETFNPR